MAGNYRYLAIFVFLEELSNKIPAEGESDALYLDGEVIEYSDQGVYSGTHGSVGSCVGFRTLTTEPNQTGGTRIDSKETGSEIDVEDNPVQEEYSNTNSEHKCHPFIQLLILLYHKN
ncbi:hypothetical protein AVEN_194784-1 [Araneus ventricosus]|uniref:Uncharacterized protein n=1 Tax=Araneus ventricosus TaxID=182803 RepID=A0A4Y2B2H0_ARAVE|nr:hypothetical protein AVEN_194784-1 [Araneus ventricosus]